MSQNLNAESDCRDRSQRKKNSALQIARVPEWISHSLPEDWYCDLIEYGDRCLAKYRYKWLAIAKIWWGVFGMSRAAIAIEPGDFIKRLFATLMKHSQRIKSATVISFFVSSLVTNLVLSQLSLLNLVVSFGILTVLSLFSVIGFNSNKKKTKRRIK